MARVNWYCSTLDSYCNKLQNVCNEITNFGGVAQDVIEGTNSGAAKINFSFMNTVETTLQDFVYGSNGLMSYLSSIAIAIAMIFFLISVLQLVTEDRFTPEFFVKFFAKFIIAFCVILWSPVILEYIIDFGKAFATMVGNAAKEGITSSGDGESIGIQLTALIKNHEARIYKDVYWNNASGFLAQWGKGQGIETMGNIFEEIGPCINLIVEKIFLGLFEIIGYVVTAIVMFIVITRILELYVRGAFLPIAASLMSDDGWKGSGGRYFRKLMSLATQNAAVLTVANITALMMRESIGNIFKDSIMGNLNLPHTHDIVALSICPECLPQVPYPINLPLIKPMLIAIIVCVAGIAMMFKANGLMDDVWGAR